MQLYLHKVQLKKDF